ncbi:YdhR family protein [Agromyces sp. Leaf222]|uniref:YdhR family protein n=1 Tax=Agromyces sp. Leaf222 TaxID=1735688 RepID=UPI0006FF0768|nr:YdhR family protein [Agromyces sp. Leaf222]KQM83104.1 monooxygenase [Agromyces sp. Leaf222]
MPVIAYFEFPLSEGPWGDDAVGVFTDLAAEISAEPGFRSKIWTEDPGRGVAGGVYVFDDAASAEAYVAKHTTRLAGFGITDIDARIIGVNEGLSALTNGAVSANPAG